MKIAAIVLVKNEEIHLRRCLNSLGCVIDSIIVIDSGSSDKSLEIAEQYESIIDYCEWVNYSNSLNYAINKYKSDYEWFLRIDADEYLSNELQQSILEVKGAYRQPSALIGGYTFNRKMVFMNKALRYGGMYPIAHLRLFRSSIGHCEYSWMDERIVVPGHKTIQLEGDLIDENMNSLAWWTQKHSVYAAREAFNELRGQETVVLLGENNGEKRRMHKSVYYSAPLFFRPILLTFYRLIFQYAWRDGARGLIWLALQGLWYRFLVDVMIYEFKHSGQDLDDYFASKYGLRVKEFTL